MINKRDLENPSNQAFFMLHCKRTVTKVQCVVSENIHTPPEEGIGNSWGGGGGLKGPKIQVNVLSLTGISREVGGGGGV